MPYPARVAQGVGYVTEREVDLAAIACGGHPRRPRGHPRSGERGGRPRGDGVRGEAADVARRPAPRAARVRRLPRPAARGGNTVISVAQSPSIV